MRFEKVTFGQFFQDFRDCCGQSMFASEDEVIRDIYDQIRIPERSTAFSAGYDFFAPCRIYIPGKSQVVIPSGIKCNFSQLEAENWHLKLYIRSSVALKHQVVLTNSVGVIDADYYGNPKNEGDIFIALWNISEVPAEFKAGEKIMQGIMEVYGLAEDDMNDVIRSGGIGSTGR